MDLSERGTAMARRHPWEQARADLFAQVLRRTDLGPGPVRVVDVGAGDGWLAGQLSAHLPAGSTIDCWDTAYSDDDLAQLPATVPASVRFIRDAPAEPADLLLCLDVAEHVADDVAFIGELVSEHLRPGGTILASVPAWQPLYSAHDAALRHHRRYSPRAFRRLIEGAGIRVEREGGMFTSLLAPRALVVLRERGTRRQATFGDGEGTGGEGVGTWGGGPAVTRVLTGVLRADAALGERLGRRGVRLPGLSQWVLGRRP